MKEKIIGLVFLSFYIFGICFPNTWWTTHFISFLNPTAKYIFLILGAIFFILPFFKNGSVSFLDDMSSNINVKYSIPALAILSATLMYRFPIISDHYGDAYKVVDQLDQKIPSIPNGTFNALFSYQLSPWGGHASVLAIITYIAYFAETTYHQAFLFLDSIFGGLYVWVWLRFVYRYFEKIHSKFLFGVAGITAPFMLLFFGHIESYAPIFFLLLLWPILLIKYLDSPKRKTLIVLAILLLISIKFHTISILYAPALLIILLRHNYSKNKLTHHFLTYEGISKWFLFPIFAIGAILYFFVFGDHLDPRELNNTSHAFERLFLPLFSPEAPLDKYNLLSANHIFDFFLEMLLWSPIALFLIASLLVSKRKEINWQSPQIVLLGSTLILFIGLFFMVNPLLSMPMDWDMMAIPAPLFIVFTATLFKQIEPQKWVQRVMAPSIGLAILSLPIFIIHTQKEPLSHRLESVGIRMFHTYYEWSDRVLEEAWALTANRKEYEDRKRRVLNELKPSAQANVDFSYARLLASEAKYFLQIENDPRKALAYLDRSLHHYPFLGNGLLYNMEAHFVLEEFDQAFETSLQLIDIAYPTEAKAASIALHCALEAGFRQEAQSISEAYLQKWHDNSLVHQIHDALKNPDTQLTQLAKLFKQER